MKLRLATFNQLANELEPYFQSEDERRTILSNSFFGSDLLDQVIYEGSAKQFTAHLINVLLLYGDVVPNKPALIHLLDTLKGQVGDDKANMLSTLQDEIRVDFAYRLSMSGEDTHTPGWARWIGLALMLMSLSVIGYTLIQLFRAGAQTIGLLAGVVGLIGTLVPLIGLIWQSMQQTFPKMIVVLLERLPSWHILLAAQVIVLMLLVTGSRSIRQMLAQDLITHGLTTANFNEARIHLDDAILLGGNVSVALYNEFTETLASPTFTDETEQVIHISRLLATDYVTTEQRQALVTALTTEAYLAIESQSNERSVLLVSALTIIDPDAALTIVRDFYNEAVTAYTSQPAQIAVARSYLAPLLTVDSLIDTDLSRTERSYVYYVNGLILELTGSNEPALNAYRQALEIDENNLEARYALASGLLVRAEQSGLSDGLDEAVTVAQIGHEEHIDGRYCRAVRQDLNDPQTIRLTQNCFLLLITEAGARSLRDSQADTESVILGLVERATRLAEANNHFGPTFFTAEAYYWMADVTDPTEDKAVYCDILGEIIDQHNFNSSRHRGWVADANEQREAYDCSQ